MIHKIYKPLIESTIMEMIEIPKEEYAKLKERANIDVDLLKQLIGSFKDIEQGKVRRVK